ncbi:hypothetical protein ABZ690_15885 [Streptomyces sp. NPDC006967]|uniref:hypothetical protein n=1 Tax=Streptomyces sp. NPDC006967 TaxID=3156906 RepID=UPI0033ECCB87
MRLDEMLAALAGVIVPAIADNCATHLLPHAPHRPPGTPLTAERVAAVTRPGPGHARAAPAGRRLSGRALGGSAPAGPTPAWADARWPAGRPFSTSGGD